MNPDVQEKLNQEIISIVGDDPEVTEQHIEKFKYLKCIVKESMRLYKAFIINIIEILLILKFYFLDYTAQYQLMVEYLVKIWL